jgi:MoxR-like ATPase
MVMATQNPAEYVGTYPLPEAQIDRFFMRISLGYPEADEEVAILKRFSGGNPLHTLEPVTDGPNIVALQDMTRKIYVEDSVYRYIVELTRRTREHVDIELGASPRGSLALFRASQAVAFYQGRPFVLPDDVKAMSVPTLAHRLILRQEARLRGQTPEALIVESLRQIPVPVVRMHGS